VVIEWVAGRRGGGEVAGGDTNRIIGNGLEASLLVLLFRLFRRLVAAVIDLSVILIPLRFIVIC